MSKRVWINLAVFAVLGAALAAWMVTNVVSFDFIDHPYTVTAQFATSPGLSPHFEVTYLGQRIGAIDKVKLEADHVEVELKIDHGVVVPAAIDAAVRRKSAVGEPYVDLAPSAGTNPEEGPRLASGANIGLDHTSTPLEYSQLFKAVAQLVQAVEPADLNTLVHELALGLEGRGDDLRKLLTGADQLSTDLAQHSQLVDQLVTDVSQLAGTLAAHHDSLGAGFDNIAALSATLAQSQQDLAALVQAGPQFTDALADIVANSKSSLGCVLDGLGTVGSVLDPTTVAALRHLISLSPQFAFVLQGLEKPETGAGGYLFFNNGSDPSSAVPYFATPNPPPAVPTVPSCASVATTAPGAGGTGTAGATPGVGAAPGGRAPGLGETTPTTTQNAEASSPKKVGGDSIVDQAKQVGIIAVLLAVLGVTLWLVRKRFGRKDGGDVATS
jgi:phospholipid/cholesterol/gamma-HCH transport system substrate-binding protein